MAIDASIYNALGGAPKSMAQYADEYAAADDRKLARQMNALQMQEVQAGMMDKARTRQEQEALRAFMGQGGDLSKPEVQRDLYKVAPTQAGAIIKGQSEASKAAVDAQASQFKLQKDRLDYAWQAVGSASSPQAAQQAILDGLSRGFFDQAQAEREVQAIPQDQAGFAQWRNGKMMAILSAKDQINAQQEAEKIQEAVRHNKRGEEITVRGQDVTATTTRRGQDMVASTAAAGRAQSERHFNAAQANQPKGQIVQSDQGIVLVDPRTGKVSPLMAPDGTPLAPKLKDLPSAAAAAITGNAQSISKIQQAIDLLDGKNVGALKGDKNATGWKAYAPQAVLNRADPGGVDTRAMIADIGSLTMHDRSGATVTASESPRLLPFIPLPTDDAATARKKLVRFKQIAEQDQQIVLDTYGKDQGYRAQKPAAAPAAPEAKSGARPPLSSFNR